MLYTESEQYAILIAAQRSHESLCVFGPPGCGKSRLINLAWTSIHPGMSMLEKGPVSLNIDDSMDAKSLVGTFRSSTSQPGRFEWVDGLLVELIRQGRWLVLEDVDKVNADILSILPREGDKWFNIPETGERVPIHPDFGLMGTSTLVNRAKLVRTLPSWLLLECGYPTNLQSIVCSLILPRIGSLILSAYNSVQTFASSRTNYERSLGLHDLFRAVHRVGRLLPSLQLTDSSVFITEFQKCQIGIQLVDLFANHSPFPARRLELMQAIESALECTIQSDSCPALSSSPEAISIGSDLTLIRKPGTLIQPNQSFTLTSVHLRAMESIARAIVNAEGMLVVGDTGVGKTTTIQFLARELGVHMHVYNLSDQTEGSDLIGGLKPVTDIDRLVADCERLVKTTLPESSMKSALAVLEYISGKMSRRDFQAVVKAVEKTCVRAVALFTNSPHVSTYTCQISQWEQLLSKCVGAGKTFQFVPGPLVKAVQNGHWILLDEINLAPADVLRILNGLLENKTVVIPETGEVVKVHPEFRLFAAMNPPHLGKGKKALPASLRSRFTELYCEEVTERTDLIKLVQQSLEQDLTVNTLAVVVPRIVDLYLRLKTETVNQLSNLEGGAPVFSLRSLSRSLEFAKRLLRSPVRAYQGDGTLELIDGLKVSLTSAMDSRSEQIVLRMIEQALPLPSNLHVRHQNPNTVGREGWALIEGHWIAVGSEVIPPDSEISFITTPSVSKNLKKLAICLAGGQVARPPILCEGSTGAGKTSLVTFLAKRSGHKLVRINNHEHTDLQDYFGQYVSGEDGGLRFQEGPLVQAVRMGQWVLLDELNLAPTEVLEALNRLLDDNRELVIPETGEQIRAHSDFVLFATQNPVTLEYAGRKALSRAFRNRFIDVQIDELPIEELGSILSAKCQIAESTATRMLATYAELSRLRRLDRVLSGRDSALVTVRDLIRWARRGPTTRDEIALEGYLVLGERLRTEEQKLIVKQVLADKVGVKNLENIVADFYETESGKAWESGELSGMVRTAALKRAVALVSRAIRAGESILLVGETGTGKTSSVQLLAQKLRIINCHQHLESGDLIGQVCPTAGGRLEWRDGPLVEACREGSWILLDEVNLAEDSVIERLNSLLDIDYRAIALAEKPGEETVVAHPEFRLLCTMNPGNDFGKKELSAALRNRFTEIWIDAIDFSPNGTGVMMVEAVLSPWGDLAGVIGEKISKSIDFAITNIPSLHASSRDAILWCQFMNEARQRGLGYEEMLAHGASVVLLDSLDPQSVEYTGMMEFLTSEFSGSNALTNEWIEDALSNKFKMFSLPSASTFTTGKFSLNAPTSACNFGRLVRAMFGSRRPILLHGDPGAGKSSVVAALALYCNTNLVRINFSDQTELADILGQNIPVENGKFEWRDGILLQAIARGEWVLLDELNLAPQPVLEGLNALLDHRSEIYVPAIDRLVTCPPTLRLFATQNEAKKGDGRKMLPRSLISRFTRIRVGALGIADLAVAAQESMGGNEEVVGRGIEIIAGLGKTGGYWNLRDLSRLLKCVTQAAETQLSGDVAWMVLGGRVPPHLLQSARETVYAICDEPFSAWIDPSRYIGGDIRVSEKFDLLKCQAEAVGAVSLALNAGCHVIITGEAGLGKQSIVRLLVPSTRLVELRMHSQMDTSDLIGQFRQNAEGQFVWVDSPLTESVRTGGVVVLSNAHCCPPAILDRLNALIEDDGVLVIPEKGTAECLNPHPELRLILLTEKPSMLSQAIRNRCIEVSLFGNAISVYDKLRSGSLRRGIAENVETVQQAHQVDLLVRAGLPLHLALSFVTLKNGELMAAEYETIEEFGYLSKSGSVVDRQMALLTHPSLDERTVKRWIIESATCEQGFVSRLARLGLGGGWNSVAWEDRVVRAMVSALIVSGHNVPDNRLTRSHLHAIVSGLSAEREFILPTDSTCFDYISRIPEIESMLGFKGAYRQSSIDLFDLISQLSCVVPAFTLVELSAAAIALRLSNASESFAKEQAMIASLTGLLGDESRPQTLYSALDSIVEKTLRLLGETDIATLLECRSSLTESDLILAGITRALEWNSQLTTALSFEERFTVLKNKFTIANGETVTGAVKQGLVEVDKIPCGDIPTAVTQFKRVRSSLHTVEASSDVEVSELTKVIREFKLPNQDVHALRREAILVMNRQIEGLRTDGEVYRLCRDVAALGVDDSGISSLIELLTARVVEIEERGVFVRPQDSSVYDQLVFLVQELQNQLSEIVSHRKTNVLVSFVNTITGSTFKYFSDITRVIAYPVLRLCQQLVCMSALPSGFHPGLPLDRSSAPSVNLLLSLTNHIETDLKLNLPSVTRQLLKKKLTELCQVKPVEVDEDEQVIVQGGIEVSLASMVEDNDKARADAAVKQMYNELFPNTFRGFLKELKQSGEGFSDDEASGKGEVKAQPPAEDMDLLAAALVAEEKSELTDIILSAMNDVGVDCPELMAAARLKLDRAIVELESLVIAKPLTYEETDLAENGDDNSEDLRDNREQKLRLSEFIRTGQVSSFYSPKGGKEAVGLLSSPLVRAHKLLGHLEQSVMEISDHPDLLHALAVVEKALGLPADCSAICALQTGEYVLSCLQKVESGIPSRYWQDNAGRGSAVMAAFTDVIAKLRANEVASWKDLRVIRESVLSRAGAGRWLGHLWRLTQSEESAVEIFDAVLGWLRNSGGVQLQFRLGLLRAVTNLSGHPVMMTAHAVAALWVKPALVALKTAKDELNKSVRALVKEIQFRLGGRHYSAEKFRMDTKRSHMQLAAVIKRFEESVSVRVEEIVSQSKALVSSDGDSEITQLVEETIQAIRSAPTDKSGKLIKQRLLSDLTAELRERLKVSVKKDFTVQRLIDGSVHVNPELIVQGMQLSNLAPVCKNNDVKPVVIAEYRSLSAYAVEAFIESANIKKSFDIESRRRRWMRASDSTVADPDTVKQAIVWVDEAKLLVEQFSVLSGDTLSFPETDLSVLVDQLESPIVDGELFVKSEMVRTCLPELLREVCWSVYNNARVRKLFGCSVGRFDHLIVVGERLANTLEQMPLQPISSYPLSVELGGASSGLTESYSQAQAVLRFTIFLHEEGLCTQEADQDQSGEGGEGSVEWTHGTGLGEGSGENDKSNEIDDAAQFDTERSEEKDVDEKKQDEGDEDKEDDQGVEANQDQGMNESDVEESSKERNEEEDDDDREMGDVDMNDGGEVDESGAPNDASDSEDDLSEEKDEIELKNNVEGENDDDGDLQEKKNESKRDRDDSKDIGADENGEEEQSEQENSEGEEDEKFEAVVDMPDNKSDDGSVENEEDEMPEDLQDVDEGEDEPMEGDEPDDDDIEGEEVQAEKVDENAKKEEDKDEEIQGAAGIDASTGGEDEHQEKSDQTNQPSAGEQKGQQAQSSGSQQESASMDASGTDTTSQNLNETKNRQSSKSSNPMEPNSNESLEEWLENIHEIVNNHQKEKLQDSAGGDVGELDDTSSKAAVASATEAVAGAVDTKEEESVSEAEKRDESESPEAEGVNRDDVIAQPEDREDALMDDVGEELESAEVSESNKTQDELKKVLSSNPVVDHFGVNTELMQDKDDKELAPMIQTPSHAVVDSLFTEDSLVLSELKATRLSSELSEKLMAVLEPTKRGRFEGFFKAGKRISMRRVLSWIASDYRKDKFWLRRTRPSHREYKIMICLDNTLSMRNNGVGEMALVCVSALAQSLQLLEVGKIGVLSFGTGVSEICPLDDTSGGSKISTVRELSESLKFNEESTSSFSDAFPAVIQKCTDVFLHQDDGGTGGSLALIITDGRFDKEKCRPYVQSLIQLGHIPVLIVMDANKQESILSVTSVHFEEVTSGPVKKRKIIRKPFLSQSDCPFPFYAVIQEPSQLPTTLADIIRQWIEISTK